MASGDFYCSMLDFPLGRKPPANRSYDCLALADAAGAASARFHTSKIDENCCRSEGKRDPTKTCRFAPVKVEGSFKRALRAKAPGGRTITHMSGALKAINQVIWQERAMKLAFPVASVLHHLFTTSEEEHIKKHGVRNFPGYIDTIQPLENQKAAALTLQDSSEDVILQINQAPQPARSQTTKNLVIGSLCAFQGPLLMQRISVTSSDQEKIIAQLCANDSDIEFTMISEANFEQYDDLLRSLPAEDLQGSPICLSGPKNPIRSCCFFSSDSASISFHLYCSRD